MSTTSGLKSKVRWARRASATSVHAARRASAASVHVVRDIIVTPETPKVTVRRILLDATARIATLARRVRLRLIDEHEEAQRLAEHLRKDEVFRKRIDELAKAAKDGTLPPAESLKEHSSSRMPYFTTTKESFLPTLMIALDGCDTPTLLAKRDAGSSPQFRDVTVDGKRRQAP